MSNIKTNTLKYDQDFIDNILSGNVDSYGENSPVDITIDSIKNGKDSYNKANKESIQKLLLLLNSPK